MNAADRTASVYAAVSNRDTVDLMGVIHVAVAVLLGGCLRDGARPYEDYLEDLARLPDAGTARDSTSSVDAAPLCSVMSFQSIDVTFSNRTGFQGDLIWVKPDCTLMPITMVGHGADVTVSTFVGHAWRLEERGSDRVLGEVRIEPNQTTVLFE